MKATIITEPRFIAQGNAIPACIEINGVRFYTIVPKDDADAARISNAMARFLFPLETLHQRFDNMLIEEVRRHKGIPPLSREEMDFREAVSEFLQP